MPKQADYQLVWSHELRAYELHHMPFCFPVFTTDILHTWLVYTTTFHVCSSTGHTFTLRKETKQRGGGYWYAYKRVNRRVEKKYIGEHSKVTLEGLEALSRYFVDLAYPSSASPPPHASAHTEPKLSPKREPTLVFTKSLSSALCIFGFPSTPHRQALVNRYRELSKQHHPDTGGLHEDMVAVNLAYDYLKKFVS